MPAIKRGTRRQRIGVEDRRALVGGVLHLCQDVRVCGQEDLRFVEDFHAHVAAMLVGCWLCARQAKGDLPGNKADNGFGENIRVGCHEFAEEAELVDIERIAGIKPDWRHAVFAVQALN